MKQEIEKLTIDLFDDRLPWMMTTIIIGVGVMFPYARPYYANSMPYHADIGDTLYILRCGGVDGATSIKAKFINDASLVFSLGLIEVPSKKTKQNQNVQIKLVDCIDAGHRIGQWPKCCS